MEARQHVTLRRFSVVVALAAFGACTDETIVYRDRAPFNPPADQSSGFLGYFTVGTKQTTCGNCHVGHQRDWRFTAHAGAWVSLQASGFAQASCEACHTISAKGNAEPGPAGYSVVPDSTYHDVQCESCHGPGLEHVLEPDLPGNIPLARLGVTDDSTVGTCGDCHRDTHHPFVEEWEQSRHAEANPEVIASYVSSPTTNTCVSCHEGRSVLKAWGSTDNYIEKSEAITASTAMGITCAVCHDPHGSPNSAQLRFPIDNPDPAQNLCMKCHLRRTTPSVSSRGNQPHAPQGGVMLAEAGYQNPNYLSQVFLDAAALATHASTTANPRLCAGCHMFRFNVNNPTQGFVQTVTGHLFRPIPCKDANGVPTDTIANCAYTTPARSFAACAGSGCHASEAQAVTVFAARQQIIKDLTRTLWIDADNDRTVDAFPTDSGYLARIKANTTDLNAGVAPVTAADGAEFNVRLVGEDTLGFMYDNGDKSHAVHNPFYAQALLQANIDELDAIYGTQPWFAPPPPGIRELMNAPMGTLPSWRPPRRASR